jgi:hypothetical protein
MGQISFIFAFFLLLFLVSCEKELKTDLQVTDRLCLNCILNPDSTIKATLSLSQSISKNYSFKKVNNALITLTQNGQPFGTLQNKGDGIYSLDSKPKEGSYYEITVQTKEYESLHAETKIPEKPHITYKLTDTIKHQYGVEIYYFYSNTITINDHPGNNQYWLYSIFYLRGNGYRFRLGYDVVDSPLIDDFNKQIDATFPLGYDYLYYLKIKDTENDGQALSISLPSRDRDSYFIMDTDEHYDKYLKSTIKQRMNDDDHLLFNEPVQIYSNIENGLGIFGSAAITSFKL